MQWKDSGDTDSIKEESEKDYYEEEYLSFKKKKFDNIISKLFNLTEMPFGLIGIGLIILIILFIIFIPKGQNNVAKKQIMSLYAELKLLENRVVKLEGIEKRLIHLEKQGKKLEQFRDRFDKSEAFLSTKMNEIVKTLDKLEKKTAKDKRIQIDSRKAVKDSKTETQPRYHQVKARETLYSISRSYGLKVDELLKLNKLAPGATIYPGQKLMVGPAKSN